VKDTGAVVRIVIANDDDTINLEKKDKWLINNTFPVKQEALDYLFMVLNNLEIQYPVSQTHRNEIKGILINKGTRVLIKSRGWTGNREFYIFQDTLTNLGSIIMKSKAKKPYVVRSPLTNIPVYMIFNTAELFWRDNTIFDFFPTRVAAIEVIYPASPALGFSIKKSGEKYVVYNNNKAPLDCYNENNIKRYLSSFTNVCFEKYARHLTMEEMDSLKNSSPLVTISLSTLDHEKVKLDLYPVIISTSNGKEEDLNRMYGFINNERKAVIVKFIDIALILRKISYFKCQ